MRRGALPPPATAAAEAAGRRRPPRRGEAGGHGGHRVRWRRRRRRMLPRVPRLRAPGDGRRHPRGVQVGRAPDAAAPARGLLLLVAAGRPDRRQRRLRFRLALHDAGQQGRQPGRHACLGGEAARIRERSGRIFSLPDEPDVARVWLPKYNMPGLAMARAFGDFCLKDYGLISMPDVSYHHITEKDEFVVLATDGVWDVLSNAEVISIVSQAKSEASAARFVVESAQRAWRTRFPTSKIDDCAVVCLFLNTDAKNKSLVQEQKIWPMP